MSETLLNQQETKTQSKTDSQQQRVHLKRIIGIILSLVMIVLTAYVLNLQNQNSRVLSTSADLAFDATDRANHNYRTYVGKYKETKIELDETTRKLEAVNRQLDQVTAELTNTKTMLSQTQGMLSDAQQENTKLKQELQGMNNNPSSVPVANIVPVDNSEVDQLQTKIKDLEDKNSQASSQLSDLQNQVRAFNADFSNLDEGRSLIVLFQNKIRLVKSRMHYLNQQLFFAKVEAQKEKDRLAVLNGNSGFVYRQGQKQNTQSTNRSFAINVNIVQ